MVAALALGSPEDKAPVPGHTGASTQSLPADGCFASGCQLALGPVSPAQTGAGNAWSEWLPVFPSGLESSGWSRVHWHSGAGQCQVSPQRCFQPEQGVRPCW